MKYEQPDLAKMRRMAHDLGFGRIPKLPVGTVIQQGAVYSWDRFPDGSIGNEWVFTNMAVTVGLNNMLDVYFRNQSQSSTWHCLLINQSSYTTGIQASDTMSSHGGWSELQTYDETTRPQWSPGAAASGALSNSTAMTFTINSSGQVRGICIANQNTKGGTTGTMWATAVDDSARSVTSGVPFQVIYENTLTSVL